MSLTARPVREILQKQPMNEGESGVHSMRARQNLTFRLCMRPDVIALSVAAMIAGAIIFASTWVLAQQEPEYVNREYRFMLNLKNVGTFLDLTGGQNEVL